MDELVQFLRDRYDEDALEAARLDDAEDAAEIEPWQIRRDETGAWDSYAYLRIAKARVLAEVEAKRELIRLAEAARDYHETFVNGFAARMEGALRLFALAYADHPAYRQEWRP